MIVALPLRHYDSCDDEDSSGVAVSKRGYHPPTASATPARTKRAEGGSPYASGYNSSEEYDVPRRADPEVGLGGGRRLS